MQGITVNQEIGYAIENGEAGFPVVAQVSREAIAKPGDLFAIHRPQDGYFALGEFEFSIRVPSHSRKKDRRLAIARLSCFGARDEMIDPFNENFAIALKLHKLLRRPLKPSQGVPTTRAFKVPCVDAKCIVRLAKVPQISRQKHLDSKQASDANRLLINQIKATLGCSNKECRWSGPHPHEIIDLHHKNPTEKKFTITSGAGKSTAILAAEVRKCIPLCANCHRLVHANKLNVEHFPTIRVNDSLHLIDFSPKIYAPLAS